jgi:hypothetical protein
VVATHYFSVIDERATEQAEGETRFDAAEG